jgi:homoserine O-acetyltransferase
MVRVQASLLKHLGVRRLAAVAGGSLGGMQVLEWAVMYPHMVERIIPIATASRHSAWCIALNEASRLAIVTDPGWKDGDSSSPPAKGLALARMIAMISYRSRESFEQRFGRHRAGHPPAAPWNTDPFADENEFEIQSYLHYQGWKLVQRFDAATYMILSRAMDAHDIGRARGPVEEVLGRISARALCIGIRSDVLYSPEEQREINGAIPRSRYLELDSPHGHDAFLIEFEKLNAAILPFLQDRSPDTEEDLLEAGRTGGTGRRAGGFL